MFLVTINGHARRRYAIRTVATIYGSSLFYDVLSLSLGFVICPSITQILLIYRPMSYKDILALSV